MLRLKKIIIFLFSQDIKVEIVNAASDGNSSNISKVVRFQDDNMFAS